MYLDLSISPATAVCRTAGGEMQMVPDVLSLPTAAGWPGFPALTADWRNTLLMCDEALRYATTCQSGIPTVSASVILATGSGNY